MASLPATRRANAERSRRATLVLVLITAGSLAAPTLYLSRAPAAVPDILTTISDPQPTAVADDDSSATPVGATAQMTEGQPVRVQLIGGGVFELVAVGEHPSKDTEWWAPDGSPAAVPYQDFRSRVGPEIGNFVREVAARWVEQPPKGTNVSWGIKRSGSGASGQALDDNGKPIKDLEALAQAFPADTKTCTIEITVARGEWETLAETNGQSIMSIGGPKYGFAFSPTSEREGKLVLVVSHNVTGKDVRVIAVDGDGKTLAVGSSSSAGASGFTQISAQFNKDKVQGVQKFEVQARDYERYEIRDVSLWPGEKTLPLVVNVRLRNRMELWDKLDKPVRFHPD
ncbi:MAG TPA: hypothetical protein VGG64_00870 [Pirellulales bacterium]|jgi:hypothetical protein